MRKQFFQQSIYFFGKLITILVLVITISSSLFAQNREIHIVKTDTPPKIDGELNDLVWQTSEKYGDFTQYDPYNGQPASENAPASLAIR